MNGSGIEALYKLIQDDPNWLILFFIINPLSVFQMYVYLYFSALYGCLDVDSAGPGLMVTTGCLMLLLVVLVLMVLDIVD